MYMYVCMCNFNYIPKLFFFFFKTSSNGDVWTGYFEKQNSESALSASAWQTWILLSLSLSETDGEGGGRRKRYDQAYTDYSLYFGEVESGVIYIAQAKVYSSYDVMNRNHTHMQHVYPFTKVIHDFLFGILLPFPCLQAQIIIELR